MEGAGAQPRKGRAARGLPRRGFEARQEDLQATWLGLRPGLARTNSYVAPALGPSVLICLRSDATVFKEGCLVTRRGRYGAVLTIQGRNGAAIERRGSGPRRLEQLE